MQNRLDAEFMRKETIATRLLQRAAELWGLDHPEQVDPIVQLLVDVLAYELARLGNEMAVSDGKLFENIAKILVPGTWLLPHPSHGVMAAESLDTRTQLEAKHHFYVPIKEKLPTGEETVTDLFFSPLQAVSLVKGRVAFRWVQNILFVEGEQATGLRLVGNNAARPGFHGLWLGLDLDASLKAIQSLEVYLKLPDAWLHLEPLLGLVSWKLAGGEMLVASTYDIRDANEAEAYNGEDFAMLHPERAVLASIAGSYRSKIHQLAGLDGQGFQVVRLQCPDELRVQLDAAQLGALEKPVCWLQLEFPAAIPAAVIAEIQFGLNCFPVVAKRMHTLQHRLHAGVNIVPLKLPSNNALFFVDQVRDDQGRRLRKRHFDNPSQPIGSYHLHQGDLERVDKTTAESYLAKMLRLVQEESSIFSAYGQDLMLKQLNNLHNDLEAIRKQLERVAQTSIQDRHYLVVLPHADSKALEVDYWSTEQRSYRHALPPGTTLLPYKQVSVVPGTARLKTPMTAGKMSPQTDERASALRYGLLTRNRIVSKQDVKQFVLHTLGGLVESVEVQNGVGVSAHPQRGFVRTVEVLLHPSPTAGMSSPDWGNLLLGLQEDLNARSVHTAAYRLRLMGTTFATLVN